VGNIQMLVEMGHQLIKYQEIAVTLGMICHDYSPSINQLEDCPGVFVIPVEYEVVVEFGILCPTTSVNRSPHSPPSLQGPAMREGSLDTILFCSGHEGAG
jgi:hypothetical protein